MIPTHRRDALGGLLMLALGAGTVLQAQSYTLGTLRRMGPGFFPTILGVLLVLVGAALLLTAWRGAPTTPTHQPPDLRGGVCICLAILAFCLLGVSFGLAPATFAIVFISALGDRDNTLWSALLLSIVMVIACIIIFWWLLQMQFPLVQWPF